MKPEDDPDDPDAEAAEVATFFVDLWANEVRRLARDVEASQDKHRRDVLAADYGEWWSPTDQDLHEGFGRLWLSEHQLIWAAHQLEAWIIRLAREQRKPEPESDPQLKHLRNALEHLSEDNLSESGFTSATNTGNGLRKLPDGRLDFGTTGAKMFGLIDAGDLQRRAWSVVTTADRLMQAAEDWVAEYGWETELEPDAEDYPT